MTDTSIREELLANVQCALAELASSDERYRYPANHAWTTLLGSLEQAVKNDSDHHPSPEGTRPLTDPPES